MKGIGMRRLVAAALILAIALPAQGCATVKNTKIPASFKDVGVCGNCKKLVAVDGLLESDVAICPECSTKFLVSDARLGFRKKIVGHKNQKSAEGLLTITWMVASVAASMYGIPVPPPPITEDTFAPYKAPLMVKCRKAQLAGDNTSSYAAQTAKNSASGGNLYVSPELSNPYAAAGSRYSVEIKDYGQNGKVEISPATNLSLKDRSSGNQAPAMLEMKN